MGLKVDSLNMLVLLYGCAEVTAVPWAVDPPHHDRLLLPPLPLRVPWVFPEPCVAGCFVEVAGGCMTEVDETGDCITGGCGVDMTGGCMTRGCGVALAGRCKSVLIGGKLSWVLGVVSIALGMGMLLKGKPGNKARHLLDSTSSTYGTYCQMVGFTMK